VLRRSKRWYRLKLKHGQEATGKDKVNSDAVANASGTAVADEEEEAPKRKKQPAKKSNAKKRKAADQEDEDGAEAGQRRVKAEKVEADDGVWQRLDCTVCYLLLILPFAGSLGTPSIAGMEVRGERDCTTGLRQKREFEIAGARVQRDREDS